MIKSRFAIATAASLLVSSATAQINQPTPNAPVAGMRPPVVRSFESPFPMTSGLRCTKQRDRALVHNYTGQTLPAGTHLEVHATGGTLESTGTGSMSLTEPLPNGQTYTSAIRYSMNFTRCTARIVG